MIDALAYGEIELKGQFTWGYNYTFLVNVHHAGSEILAIYKPQKGEQPLWDFPENSLAGREVAAYTVSQALGFGLVPLTVLRNGPFGPGSLQQYVEYNPEYHYFTFKTTDRQRLRPMALFDLLVNNADRKGSHMIVQKRTRRLFGIDHGLCFHVEDKLRTVIWDFAGEDIPPELLSALGSFRSALTGSLSADLQPYLSSAELAPSPRVRRQSLPPGSSPCRRKTGAPTLIRRYDLTLFTFYFLRFTIGVLHAPLYPRPARLRQRRARLCPPVIP